MKDHYNFIANHYDRIAQLVFGKDLSRSERYLIDHLPDSGRLLILGGGTGRNLPYLFETHPYLHIVFQEASSHMLKIARLNSPPNQNIEFIYDDRFHLDRIKPEYILACYFLDALKQEEIYELILRSKSLKSGSPIWYIADFSASGNINFINRLKLKLSIIFFRILGSHPYQNFRDVFEPFIKSGYKMQNVKYLKNGFIRSEIMHFSE